MSKTTPCWVIEEQTYGGSRIAPTAYLVERTAQLACAARNKHAQDCSYVVLPRQLRILNETEGAIDNTVFMINNEEPGVVLRRTGLAKLTHEERLALNLNPDGTPIQALAPKTPTKITP